MKFMNKLTPAGLPSHHLHGKKGMVLMLLQSLSPKQGHCNSTKLILNKATNILLYCKIATEDYARGSTYLQNWQFIEWNRRQFPIRPAFAMTINKIQGQTQKSRSLARGTHIHSWAALCHSLKGMKPSTSPLCSNQES